VSGAQSDTAAGISSSESVWHSASLCHIGHHVRGKTDQNSITRLRQMHQMQSIAIDVRGVCPSVCLSCGSAVCGAFVHPLPNYFGQGRIQGGARAPLFLAESILFFTLYKCLKKYF